MNICIRATSIVDTYCNQVLRATVDNEYLTGPGSARFGFQQGSGLALLYMRRWPVTEVLAIQASPNRLPRRWEPVPSGLYEVNHPLINMYADTASATAPDGGSSIVVDPCGLYPAGGTPGGWRGAASRNGLRLIVSYTNGWPHTSLTQFVQAGAQTLYVDDVTGWTGASGFVYDGSSTESVSVASVAAAYPVNLPNGVGTAQAGPGTVTLASPLAFGHNAGVLVSSLPANVMQAAILAAAAQALESGIESISIQALPGTQTSSGHGVQELVGQYKEFLDPFRRII